MRAGTDTALTPVVTVFGAAHPHHAYLFANRMKVLGQDGIGIWLAARRLRQGKVAWPAPVVYVHWQAERSQACAAPVDDIAETEATGQLGDCQGLGLQPRALDCADAPR